MKFERLIQFGKDEGDAARARIESLRPTGTTVPGILKTTRRSTPTLRTLAFLEPSGSFQNKEHVSQDKNTHAEPPLGLSATEPDSSVVTSELPLTITSEPPVQLDEKALPDHEFALNEEQLLWMEKHNPRTRPGPRQVRPQSIREIEATNRVGWRNETPKIICLGCYEHVRKDSCPRHVLQRRFSEDKRKTRV